MPESTQTKLPGLEPLNRVVNPGVRGVTKRNIKCGTEVVPKGSDVIIQPLDDGTYLLTTFRKDDRESMSFLPEGQRDVIADKTFKTFPIKDPNSAFNFTEHYQATSMPLFPKDDSPSLEEMRQGQIPDCFLLASVQSILQNPKGKDYIRDIMKQNDDGTTTVRLFNPKTLIPEYVTVPNAVLVDNFGRPLNSHKALWIHVLESAYTAMQFKNDSVAGLVEADASFSSVFSGGGQMTTADKILLGCDAKLDIISPPPAPWKISEELFKQINELAPFDVNQFKLKIPKADEILSIISSIMPPDGSLEQGELEQNSFELYKKYFEFYKENKGAIDGIMNSDISDARKMLDIIDITVLQEKGEIAKFLTKTMNYEYVRTTEISVRHEVEAFKGVYSENQIEIYNRIKAAMEKGEVVGVGTTEIEMTIEGLVGSHAYSVFGVREAIKSGVKPASNGSESSDGEEDEIIVRYVQLKNPWGRFGRTYEQHEGELSFEAVATEEGIFELELSEFCKYIRHVDITQGAQQRFDRERRKQELLNNAIELGRTVNWMEPSLKELVEYRKVFSFEHVLEYEQLRFEELYLDRNPVLSSTRNTGPTKTFYQLMDEHRANTASNIEDRWIHELAVTLRDLFPSSRQDSNAKSVRYRELKDYLTNNPDGQQLLRLWKLDYLENINNESRTSRDVEEIKNLKQEIFEHSNSELKSKTVLVQKSLSLSVEEFERKLDEFNEIAAELEALVSSNQNNSDQNNELFNTYIKLNAKFTELDVMYELFKELDPKLKRLDAELVRLNPVLSELNATIERLIPEIEKVDSPDLLDSRLTELSYKVHSELFYKIKKCMEGSKERVHAIDEYKNYLAAHEKNIVSLLQRATNCVDKDQLDSTGMSDINNFVNNPAPDLDDVRHITQNNKMPDPVKDDIVQIYKFRNILSNLFRSIVTEIGKFVSLWKGHDYMLVNNSEFDRKALGGGQNFFKDLLNKISGKGGVDEANCQDNADDAPRAP